MLPIVDQVLKVAYLMTFVPVSRALEFLSKKIRKIQFEFWGLKKARYARGFFLVNFKDG